ncbi:efflux transporter periplasmic adaptor subunit [candidate division KSB1 bacterium RBG_16_48_16]|nr:MAG: efflux transporter periplasmic adaptor subunit [candidate division KSB1 bacterium RBG_16_48_16]
MKPFCIISSFFFLLYLGCGNSDVDIDAEIVVPVSVEEIGKKAIKQFVNTTGTVRAMQEATLKAETEGFYRLNTNATTGKPFALGDFVKKDAVIIFLDNPELENNTKIESQKLALDISSREYEKQQSLYDKGGVTLRELKDAERSYFDARYSFENAKIQLAKLQVQAPFDGIIVDLPYYTPGVKVELSSTMVQMMSYKRLYLEASLPANELGKVKVSQPVEITNYTLPEDTLAGAVTQVSPAIDATTRSFKAAIEVDNPELLLRPGMFVKADIVVAVRDSALVISKDVIQSRQRGKTVYVVERGAAQERVITTGIENPAYVEVVDGVKENERLIVKGFETLRNNSKVKVIR